VSGSFRPGRFGGGFAPRPRAPRVRARTGRVGPRVWGVARWPTNVAGFVAVGLLLFVLWVLGVGR